MEKLIRWFVNNKVVSNLLMILIIITGATKYSYVEDGSISRN
ncbi:hypothetical protein Ct9H90mP29_02430 [bacterium]|nr:MAG: hypothetical protein Ct9H90mP29_02430 [bacterium]